MKTGTTSLSRALKLLGLKGKHFDRDFTPEILETKKLDFYVDMPAQTRYPALDTQYPDSGFILTVRDTAEWLESCQKWLARRDLASKQQSARYGEERIRKVLGYRQEQFGSTYFEETRFRQVQARHTAEVQAYFEGRSSDLLVLNICAGDGWPELCNFLGLPIASHAFPHENRRKR
ncbi:MAG: sulfotransferase [Pseudomonadota bacterium]